MKLTIAHPSSQRIQRQSLSLITAAVLLPLIAAGAVEDATPSSSENWQVIDAYGEAIGAHRGREFEIRNLDVPDEEKERLRSELGPRPDDTPAMIAATAIIESNGDRMLEAADFLLNRTRPPEETQLRILDALAPHFGPDWSLVQAYIESQAALLETIRAENRDEAAQRRIQQGVEPPTWHAVVAARAIVESNHERALEAAEFLMQQTYAMGQGGMMMLSSWWLDPSRELGEAALAELIGPDWSVIEEFNEASESWRAAQQAVHEADTSEEDKAVRLRELGDAPTAFGATAAALAIINVEGVHEKTRKAAEFLLDNPVRGGAAKALQGAEALAVHFPDYDQWPLRLKQVDALSSAFQDGKSFIIELSETLDEPLARATARYFAASYLIEEASHGHNTADERTALKERASDLATGLSAGIENETFVLMTEDADGNDTPMTLADAEAELFYSLHSTMVGSVVSDVRARRVDGSVDSLVAYAGRVILVDFWATWCGPCIQAFPKLREMADELPKEHFQIIGVNVDEEFETVTEYLADESLPWIVWHVGKESELVRRWRVTGYPTYVLIGPDGTILSKYPGIFNAEFRAEIEQAVRDVGA